MSKELLIANYEIKRLLILTTFINHPDRIEPALAYAYENRIAPIFHEGIAREHHNGIDPYDSIYWVKPDFIKRLVKFIDAKSLEKDFKALAFDKIEDEFGGYKANRLELAYSIRYTRLRRHFDDDVYKAILDRAPMEAHSIHNTNYGPDDVCLAS